MTCTNKIKLISFKNQKTFDEVNRRGQKIVGRYFIIIIDTSQNSQKPEYYLGLKVSKKMGNAIIRNKIRRQLKHMIRDFVKSQSNTYYGAHFLIVPKKQITEAKFSELQKDCEISCKKHDIKIY